MNMPVTTSREEYGFVKASLLELTGIDVKTDKEMYAEGIKYKPFPAGISEKESNDLAAVALGIHRMNLEVKSNVDKESSIDKTQLKEIQEELVQYFYDTAQILSPKYKESIKTIGAMYLSGEINSELYKKIIEAYTKNIELLADYQKQTKQIFDTALKDNRNLTEKDQVEISKYLEEAGLMQFNLIVNGEKVDIAKSEFINRLSANWNG